MLRYISLYVFHHFSLKVLSRIRRILVRHTKKKRLEKASKQQLSVAFLHLIITISEKLLNTKMFDKTFKPAF